MKKIEYIDLGLRSGILWSDCNISGVSFSTILKLSEEQYRCYSKFLPTLEDFEELYKSCIIRQYQKGGYDIYLIIGPNKNKVRIVRGVASNRSGLLYHPILYWLRDGFFESKERLPKAVLATQLDYYGNKFIFETEQYANLIFVKRNEN